MLREYKFCLALHGQVKGSSIGERRAGIKGGERPTEGSGKRVLRAGSPPALLPANATDGLILNRSRPVAIRQKCPGMAAEPRADGSALAGLAGPHPGSESRPCPPPARGHFPAAAGALPLGHRPGSNRRLCHPVLRHLRCGGELLPTAPAGHEANHSVGAARASARRKEKWRESGSRRLSCRPGPSGDLASCTQNIDQTRYRS